MRLPKALLALVLSPLVVGWLGAASAHAALKLKSSPKRCKFEAVASRCTATVTNHTKDTTLTVSVLEVSEPAGAGRAFAIVAGTCAVGLELAPGQSCTSEIECVELPQAGGAPITAFYELEAAITPGEVPANKKNSRRVSVELKAA